MVMRGAIARGHRGDLLIHDRKGDENDDIYSARQTMKMMMTIHAGTTDCRWGEGPSVTRGTGQLEAQHEKVECGMHVGGCSRGTKGMAAYVSS